MKKIFLIISLAILISFPLISLAAGLVPCGGDQEPVCQFCHLFILFKNVVDFLLKNIVPALAILMLAIGGFMYVLAYANPSEGVSGSPGLISQAKRLITSVFLGLVIIFAAWLIVNFFFQMIGVQKWTRLTDDPATTEKEGWWKVDCPAPGSQSQSQPQGNTVSFANFQDVLARASASLFSDNPLLTDAELKDLGDLYSSSPPNTIDLSGTGALSGEKLIDIYNKVK